MRLAAAILGLCLLCGCLTGDGNTGVGGAGRTVSPFSPDTEFTFSPTHEEDTDVSADHGSSSTVNQRDVIVPAIWGLAGVSIIIVLANLAAIIVVFKYSDDLISAIRNGYGKIVGETLNGGTTHNRGAGVKRALQDAGSSGGMVAVQLPIADTPSSPP